jgi:Ca2+-transporting ATPase
MSASLEPMDTSDQPPYTGPPQEQDPNQSNEPIELDVKVPTATDAEEQAEDPNRVEVERLPQTFVEYDEPALEELFERRNAEGLVAQFESVPGLASVFKTDLERGIETSSLAARGEQWGINLLSKKDPATFLEFLLEALEDRVIQILCAAAAISIIFGMTLPNPHTGEVDRSVGWIEGTAIIISVTIVVLVGSINNYQKAKKFEEMEKEQAIKTVEVIRDGEQKSTTTDTLQPGDLLKIEVGMEMTCDALVVRPQGLKMNESAITGEPDLIEKSVDRNPFIISGTFVEEGDALVMVVAIGMRSVQGRLKGALDADSDGTPLQEHLEQLADRIGLMGLVAAIILVVALSLKEIIVVSTRNDRAWSAPQFLNFFLVAVALIAVAIPEGLPLAVTIALAFSMKAMMADNCMVRILASCETMGAATAVCSDKTGTLTLNQMTLVQGYIAGQDFMLDGHGMDKRHDDVQVIAKENVNTELGLTQKLRDLFAEGIALNSTASEVVREGVRVWTGNKTEMGMLKFLALIGKDYEQIRTSANDAHSYPFSSAKKRMTTLVRTSKAADAPCTVHAKGASEAILAECKHMFNAAGDVVAMTAVDRSKIEDQLSGMARQANRTIGIAVGKKPLEVGPEYPKEDPTDELVWLGVVGIQDPMRSEVPHAVQSCTSAGLTVRMVTGDNILTAIAIAKNCGIYAENGFDLAMTGPDFRWMADNQRETLKTLVPRLRVLARSSPSDKHVLVGLLQEQGEVVAVTGDGTNDAPALKLADVGFAMNSGTDIAKGAADMVLLDDNFASVVNAVRWGRSVNDNVKKFLQFQLTINVAGVLLTLIGSLASEHSKEPFTPVQMLWLNMIMDTLAALSLATELPEEACMTRSPVYKQAPLLTNRMRVFIGFHAFIQVLVILLVLFLGHRWFETVDFPEICNNINGEVRYEYCKHKCEEVGGVLDGKYCQQGRVHSAMIFNIFIFFQVFNVANSRKIYGEMNPLEGVTTRSRTLVIIFGVIALLQALAVEFAGEFMSVTGLSAREWGICIGFASIEIVAGIICRFIPVTDTIPEEIIEHDENIAKIRAECEANPGEGIYTVQK